MGGNNAVMPKGIRINRLSIKNYKKIDSLEIEFPRPLMEGDMDVLVLGSKNGGGKTSVLECCVLLIFAGIVGNKDSQESDGADRFRITERLLSLSNLMIRSGCEQATIQGYFEKAENKTDISLFIKGYHATCEGGGTLFEQIDGSNKKLPPEKLQDEFDKILSFSGEPLILPPLLYFNSYRKVQESNPELGMIADDFYLSYRSARHLAARSGFTPISSFKLEIIQSLMGKASLFEGVDKDESDSVLLKLNSLIERYCGGVIQNLRLQKDNTVDIRISLKNKKTSFSFDGLSSGQKEMIATLFLIWKNTREQPGIVLIDEPELHLNAEWHSDFIWQLHKLAPHNQYILATHSEEIFRSVEPHQRVFLVPDGEASE